jgi:hypothetical protein
VDGSRPAIRGGPNNGQIHHLRQPLPCRALSEGALRGGAVRIKRMWRTANEGGHGEDKEI